MPLKKRVVDCYNNNDNLSYIGAGWEKPRLTKEEAELRRIGQKCLALIMALAMAFTCMVPAFAAGEQYQVELDVTYSQTEARTLPAAARESMGLEKSRHAGCRCMEQAQ